MLSFDSNETYFLVMDIINFQFLITILASNKLDVQLIDVIIAYLYGLLGNDIYIHT